MPRNSSSDAAALGRHNEGLQAGLRIISGFLSDTARRQAAAAVFAAYREEAEPGRRVALHDLALDLEHDCPLFGVSSGTSK